MGNGNQNGNGSGNGNGNGSGNGNGNDKAVPRNEKAAPTPLGTTFATTTWNSNGIWGNGTIGSFATRDTVGSRGAYTLLLTWLLSRDNGDDVD